MLRHLLSLTFILVVSAFATGQSVESRLQAELDKIYAANKSAVGISVHVEAPDTNLSWSAAAGLASIAPRVPLKPEQPVLLASNTKPYVAAAILRLVEEKELKLDQPIEKILTEESARLLRGDGYDLSAITVRHLLSHTSGIHDYVDENYFNFVSKNPRFRWTRTDQLQRAMDVGTPLGAPGTQYTYADVNYVLLTEILEQVNPGRFYRSMKYLLRYQSLGINHTWFKDVEARPPGTAYMAHQYSGERGWDSYDLNPHWDMYGGGGIASPAKDAALFFNHLFNGRVILDEDLLEEMTTHSLPGRSNYGLGIQILERNGSPAYYHGGWWGTDVIHYPEQNVSISVFTLQRDARGSVNAALGDALFRVLTE
ncbi:serine hydrolase [Lewinella sp. 4G2]|uniref:serine hydrolase domain-containing protein n=1 Tax=Lewinella sp. 4G2 TaxID=1803372 RepID=UPI0007B47571|nr:serine hydrolase domain-containing protein [Lewinella sp. 4G2]OAV43987.1 hypothetical protein A3850_005530 [Lewinella sp. 4G2]